MRRAVVQALRGRGGALLNDCLSRGLREMVTGRDGSCHRADRARLCRVARETHFKLSIRRFDLRHRGLPLPRIPLGTFDAGRRLDV